MPPIVGVLKRAGVLSALFVLASLSGAALPTAMNYQGQLLVDGVRYTGDADVRVSLWSSAAGQDVADRVAGPITLSGVQVSAGVFTIAPDFGDGAFTGASRYLQVEVRTPSGGGSFVAIGPRTEVLAAPTAQYAGRATELGSADGAHPHAASVTNSGTLVVNAPALFAGPIEVAETQRVRQFAPASWVSGAYPIGVRAGGAYVESTAPGGTLFGSSFLAFELPQGSVLKQVSVAYIDASNWGDLTVKVRKAVTGTDLTSQVIASASSTGNVATARTLTIGALQVDSPAALYLEATWETTNVDPIRIGTVTITYAVTSPLP